MRVDTKEFSVYEISIKYHVAIRQHIHVLQYPSEIVIKRTISIRKSFLF
jgi:hypothetical protein